MKLYYYKKNKKFHCYTDCGDNFNIYELFKRRYELLNIKYDFFQDIVLKIADGKNITFNSRVKNIYGSEFEKYKKSIPQISIPEIPEHLLNTFVRYYTIEWLRDGINEAAMDSFNILFSVSQNKIIIPHYNDLNKLIGIRGRSLNQEDIELGKYMPVQIEGKIYAHPLGYNLFGLNKNKENIRKRKMAIIVEGEKSVLQYETMYGRDNNICVAVCGNNISKYQIDLLLKYNVDKIVIAFDEVSNPNSYKEKQEQFNKLIKICNKYRSVVKMGFIMDNKGLLKSKDSPTDNGKEIFEKLIKYIQWV